MQKRNRSSSAAEKKKLAKVLAWAKENLASGLTVEQLAAKAALSPRHLARIFWKEMDTCPSHFLEEQRVQAAMCRLKESDDAVAKVAIDCGFGSRSSLYRSFMRVVQVSPAEYRSRCALFTDTKANAPVTDVVKQSDSDSGELPCLGTGD